MLKVICRLPAPAPALAGSRFIGTVTVTAALPSAIPGSAAGTSASSCRSPAPGRCTIAVEGHGDRLACFGSRCSARVRSCAASAAFSILSPLMVLMVTAGAAVSTQCLRGRGCVAVHVGDADLAGVASFSGSRYGAGPGRCRPSWSRFYPPRSRRSRTAPDGRVKHVVVRHAVDAYRHRARSTSTTVPIFTGLPEVSCALALMVSDPSAHRETSAAGTAACQLPSASTRRNNSCR